MILCTRILPVLLSAAVLTAAAQAADFDRTLPASSATDIYVATGSGRIHIYPGSDSELHVKAHIHAGWNAGGDIDGRNAPDLRQPADHPGRKPDPYRRGARFAARPL